MAGGNPNSMDLLGETASWDSDLYSVPRAERGKIVDLSGSSSSSCAPTRPVASLASSSRGLSSFGGGSSNASFSAGGGSQGPTSIEGGSSVELSLNGLTPASIMRQLASRPITDLVSEHGRHLLDVPRYMVRAYTAAAQRYLRPWNDFIRMRPNRIIEGFQQASRRGELQIHLQQNVLANAKAFCPNYLFIFLAMMFMFVCTSPVLLAMLGVTGGGWSHALRSEHFRSRPWTLQIGGVYVPLGANVKMAVMTLPTLLMLHFFMGPVLWSAALYSGGIGLAHAALRDRDDDRDDHSDGPASSVRIQELP